MNAKYYVLAKSAWQGDTWGAVAGPFTDLDEANKVSEGKSIGEQDIKHTVYTRVVNTTTMRRVYGISKEQALESIYYARQQEKLDEELMADWEKQVAHYHSLDR